MATTLQARLAIITGLLSQPRLGPYLAVCGGDIPSAVKLYQWNVELSGAVYEALHVVEVTLRNALDAQLSAWNCQQVDAQTGHHHSSDWLMDPARLLQRLAGDDIGKATGRAKRALMHRRAPGHPDILAQLSFGTWRFLLPSQHDPGRQLLWTAAASKAFPHLTTPVKRLVADVTRIHELRNRVAHLEPLLRRGTIEAELAAMRSVIAAIEPIMETWMVSRQRITSVLKARP